MSIEIYVDRIIIMIILLGVPVFVAYEGFPAGSNNYRVEFIDQDGISAQATVIFTVPSKCVCVCVCGDGMCVWGGVGCVGVGCVCVWGGV